MQILGADAFRQEDIDAETKSTIDFIEAILKSDAVRGYSEILFFAESNYGGSSRAKHVYDHVMEWASGSPYKVRGILAHDKSNPKPGFWLTRSAKERMALKTKLLLDNGRMVLAKQFIAPHLGGPNAVLKLWTQLDNYEKRFKFDPDIDEDRPREEALYTSVYSGKTAGQSDDMAVILQEAVLLQTYLETNKLSVTHGNEISRPPVLDPRVRDGRVEDRVEAEFEAAARKFSKRSRLIYGPDLGLGKPAPRERELRNDEDHMDSGEAEDQAMSVRMPLRFVDEEVERDYS